jgi:endonuclease/exonuclease/phosphatase family metal-dependent hydrolase
MSYRIGSLNINKRRHKESKEEESSERDFFEFIHNLVVKERLDVLALQEVLNENELQRIRDRALSPLQNWKGHYERPATGRSGDYGFAFLWNEDRVAECSKNHTPRIFSEYKSDLRLSRNPLYGRFSPKMNPNAEIHQEYRLVNVHLRFTDEVLPDLTKILGVQKRRIECALVTGEIYRKIDTHRYGNFKSAFTISMGDYNLDADECNRCSGNPDVVTYQSEPTTLNDNYDGYANSYDHFSYDYRKHASIPVKVLRIDAVKDYFGGEFEQYYQAVSDHVPVIIEIF